MIGAGGPAAPGPADGGAAIRCLIADDQAMVRESFAAILAAQPGITVAGQAADGAQAVSQARRLRPDVVLLDVRMPVMNGLAAARELLSGGEPGPRVLMLTTFDLDEYVYAALRAGARDSCSRTPPPPSWCMPSASWPPATHCWRRRSPGG